MKQSDALKDIISDLYKLFGREAVEAAIVEARTDLAYEQIKEYQDKLDEPLRCKCGLVGCVYEPAYIKKNYPDWYEELGCPITCEDCENGERYDDEDK